MSVEIEGVLDGFTRISVSEVFESHGGVGDWILGTEEAAELIYEELCALEPGGGTIDKVSLEPVEGGSLEIRQHEGDFCGLIWKVRGSECDV
jgi:hypothetical protein